MKIQIPQPLAEWTNANWPDLATIGGLESIEYEVVDKLPFGNGSHAMAWNGRVLVRRGWIEYALQDLGPDNTLNPRHLWAVNTLAFHEPLHIIEQSQRSWWIYLVRYVFQWIKSGFSYRDIEEEKAAYSRQARLAQKYFDEVGKYTPKWTFSRPK